jgi:hypothetical protein
MHDGSRAHGPCTVALRRRVGYRAAAFLASLVIVSFRVHSQSPADAKGDDASPLLELPALESKPKVESAEQLEGERKLGVQAEGRGEVRPNTVLLAQPGEILRFRVTLANPASAGPRQAARPSAFVGNQPGRYVAQTARALALQTTGGGVEILDGSSLVWTAPGQPGWQKIIFELEEAMSCSGPGGGTSGGAPGTTRARQEVPVMVQFPFDRDGPGVLGGYAIGLYPNEKAADAGAYVQRYTEQYAPPKWFIQVTPETEGFYVSDHFRLADFSPPAEQGKQRFIALKPELVRFLEAVWTRLQEEHGDSARLVILRSYLSPNERQRLAQKGVQYTTFTRYQYGDAAAIVANTQGGDGMSDLNRDGAVDPADAEALANLVDRVRAATQTRGGLGVVAKPIEPGWPDTPFVVVDLRGVNTRW